MRMIGGENVTREGVSFSRPKALKQEAEARGTPAAIRRVGGYDLLPVREPI